MRSVRLQADRLGLDYCHFTGQRRWTDQELINAISSATSWTQVAEMLGLAGGASSSRLKGHAVRLGLEVDHLSPTRSSAVVHAEQRPRSENLARAGSLLAASWFELCGCSVSWPLEPCRYDLIVWTGSRAERIQVKTTRARTGNSWTVWLSTTSKGRRIYDPDEIDQFFIIDGDLAYYLVPIHVVGGLSAIRLAAYQEYRVPQIPTSRPPG
jgi:hypothetical protein